MDMEEQIIRYKNIITRLRKINSKIEALNTNVGSLKTTTEKCIIINGKVINENSIDSITKNLRVISTTINNNIQSLNRKIYN